MKRANTILGSSNRVYVGKERSNYKAKRSLNIHESLARSQSIVTVKGHHH